jgi:DNA-binding MarR family transcriptional regulator
MYTGGVAAVLPLPTLLSQALVAFTIEFDNEFEHQMPHRTTNHGSTAGPGSGPWLVSLAMWSNCMQFLGETSVSVGELEALARTKTNLNGMERWGYIVVEPDSAGNRMIRATAKGRKAQEVWKPLFGVIEQRWAERFGLDEIGQVRESLRTLIRQIDLDLPDCLPILGYGLFSKRPDHEPAGRKEGIDSRLPLSALLSKVLLAFAIEFERESELSLAIHANVVRVLDEKGVRLRDLPLLSGVSKEAISTAMGILQKRGFAAVGPDQTASRVKTVRLTPKGSEAQDAYRRLVGSIEERWQVRFGKKTIRTLRESLEPLVREPTGLKPYPDGWRASVRKPTTLPHYPMVLHRGGFPDGS